MEQGVFARRMGRGDFLQQRAGLEAEDAHQPGQGKATTGLLILRLGAGLAISLGVGEVKARAVNDFERAGNRQPGQEAFPVKRQAVGQVATDVHQLADGPTGAGLAIAAGVLVDLRAGGLALVVGLDLIQGFATRGAGIEDLVQKGHEGEFGGKDALAVRVIGGQEGGGQWVNKGPYYLWTGKRQGKTVCYALSKAQYEVAKQAIAANRRVLQTLTKLQTRTLEQILKKAPGVRKRKQLITRRLCLNYPIPMKGARRHVRIRSYISTLRKHGLPVLKYLRRALDSNPFLPMGSKTT